MRLIQQYWSVQTIKILASETVESGSNQRTGKQDKFEVDILTEAQGTLAWSFAMHD